MKTLVAVTMKNNLRCKIDNIVAMDQMENKYWYLQNNLTQAISLQIFHKKQPKTLCDINHVVNADCIFITRGNFGLQVMKYNDK